MAVIIFGNMEKTKIIGVRGDKMACYNCHREYSQNLILQAEYFHIDYIPIAHHRDRDVYNTVCPICGFRDFIQTFKATAMLDQTVSKEVQDISYLAVKKDKKLYDFVAMDNLTKEQIFIASNVKKGTIKSGVRLRGAKKKDIIYIV